MLPADLGVFAFGAIANLAVAALIVRFIYYPAARQKTFVFSFLAFSTVIYFALRFLTSVELGLGVGFGLFAIFSILRYRTAEVPIREMTYLFTIIGLAVMNAFLQTGADAVKLAVANGAVVVLLAALERGWGFRWESSTQLLYEKIDLIGPAKRDALLADVRERTGLPVKRVEVGRIDFLRDVAEVTLYYDEPRPVQCATEVLAIAGTRPIDRFEGPVAGPTHAHNGAGNGRSPADGMLASATAPIRGGNR